MIGGDWHAFFETWIMLLGRASLHGAIAIGLVWGICRLIPRIPPHIRCWLWRLALLKMVLALLPLSTFDLPFLPSSWPQSSAKVISMEVSPPVVTKETLLAPTASAGSSQIGSDPATDSIAPATSIPVIPTSPPASVSPSPPHSWSLAVLCTLWGIIVVGFLSLIASHIRTARRSRHQWRLLKDHDILTLNEQLAGQMGLFQPPVLFQSESCPTPVVFGVVRTAIVLPADLVSKASLDEIRLVLAHEMPHVIGKWEQSTLSPP